MLTSPRRCIGDFNPLPSYEGRLRRLAQDYALRKISIHSPHTRGDSSISTTASPATNFNPLPSYEGRRARYGALLPRSSFQSTPLIRGETGGHLPCNTYSRQFQSTPLIRGETLRFSSTATPRHHFNPLPSYEGRRPQECRQPSPCRFQSTPLIRGETYQDSF